VNGATAGKLVPLCAVDAAFQVIILLCNTQSKFIMQECKTF